MDAPEARAAATKLLETGTDGLKLYAVTIGRNGISLTGPTIEALVDEAHRRQKPVFAHATTEAGLAAAVGGGVDVIVHTTPQSGPWSEGAATMMKDRRVGLIPTPALWRYELGHERLSFADRFEQAALDQLRAWLCAGGQVLFGTDVGYVSEYDPTGEYVLMAAAGMTFRQILASLTTAPTERFGESDRLGRIATGLVADLVVLQRDPGGDIRAFAAVRYTIRDGVVIYDSGSR